MVSKAEEVLRYPTTEVVGYLVGLQYPKACRWQYLTACRLQVCGGLSACSMWRPVGWQYVIAYQLAACDGLSAGSM